MGREGRHRSRLPVSAGNAEACEAPEMVLQMTDPTEEEQEATRVSQRAEGGMDSLAAGTDTPSGEVGEGAGVDEAGIHPAVVGQDIHGARALRAQLQPSYGA